MKRIALPRLTFWRSVAIGLFAIAAYVIVVRFTQGLGAATNLSDDFPWGLWIGFDLLCGVGLAAGGFTITAVVYVFNMKKYQSITRPAILTAFLGYLLVIVALLFDLGKPWNIWHPLVMHNPHSVMFEVAWCVMLYTTVLALEFSTMVFERFNWQKPLAVLRKVTIVLVIFGVLLSTLHQSSLGSLYLIVPSKMSPLWYSPMLPVLFFFSAVMVGLAMVIFESFLSYRAFRKHLEPEVLYDLARGMVLLLLVYLVMRFSDLFSRDVFNLAFVPSEEAALFWLEILIGGVAPVLIFSHPKLRLHTRGLFLAATCVVLGFVLNRMNVAITAFVKSTDYAYFPSWMEIVVTMALVAAGFTAFSLAVKYFPVFGTPLKAPAGAKG